MNIKPIAAQALTARRADSNRNGVAESRRAHGHHHRPEKAERTEREDGHETRRHDEDHRSERAEDAGKRVDFRESLRQFRAEKMTSMLQEKATDIVAGLRDQVQNLAGKGLPEAESLLADFQAKVEDLFDEDEPLRPHAVLKGLRKAFGQFMTSLQELAGPPPVEQAKDPVTPPVAVMAPADATSSGLTPQPAPIQIDTGVLGAADTSRTEALNGLKDWFKDQMHGLKRDVHELRHQQGRFGHRGLRAAFEELLTMYQNLKTSTDNGTATTEGTSAGTADGAKVPTARIDSLV